MWDSKLGNDVVLDELLYSGLSNVAGRNYLDAFGEGVRTNNKEFFFFCHE